MLSDPKMASGRCIVNSAFEHFLQVHHDFLPKVKWFSFYSVQIHDWLCNKVNPLSPKIIIQILLTGQIDFIDY